MIETRQGYYHHPTVQDNYVVFICEDDLWSVSLDGGIPRRLTSNLGIVSYPRLSPGGKWLAFCGREEGQPDVYVMPAEGGEMRRLTFLGAVFKIAAWTNDGEAILFLSSHRSAIPLDQPLVYRVSLAGEYPQSFLNCPVRNIALNPRGSGLAIGRNNFDNARWKRYRGGTAGEIWIDPDFQYENIKESRDNLVKLNLPQGNPNGPLWIDDRIYFASDQDGVGNLYSCTLRGEDLRRETAHRDFYVRHPSTDGKTILYQAGADLYALEVATREVRRLPIQWRSPRVQTQRKFSSAARYFENHHLHPKGHSIALTARGKLFSMAHWEGAPVQYGVREGARYRLACWLNDGKRLAAISDQNPASRDEEKLVLFSGEPSQEPERLFEVPPGRIQTLIPSPASAQVALTTSRLDLWSIDLETGNQRRLDHNEFYEINGVAYSPDGRWLAYRKPLAEETSAIFLCELESGAVHQVTQPVLYDFNPQFDPDGRYLYFISTRVLNPVNDVVQFAVSFPAATKPYLITLRKDLASPFVPAPAAPGEESAPKLDSSKANGKDEKKSDAVNGAEKAEEKEKPAEAEKTPEPMRIDLDGIQHRVIEFPVKEGIHRQVMGIKDKVVFTSFPIRGRADLGDSSASDEDDEKGTLWVYDFVSQKLESIAYDVQSIQ
ncbi:MAG: S41 family peptidase, partial [bacterium]